MPEGFSNEQAAPLLCAGIIGYRALRQAAVPPGGRLGIFGFGGSAHLVAQVALAEGIEVHVFTRSARARELAMSLGVASASASSEGWRLGLDSALLFAPVGSLVPSALETLDRGGTLAVAGIYVDEIPSLDYERDLFQERRLRSVTANTRVDGQEFLAIAARIGIQVSTTPYPLEAAGQALVDLARGPLRRRGRPDGRRGRLIRGSPERPRCGWAAGGTGCRWRGEAVDGDRVPLHGRVEEPP
jgi:alcohol dehydrogenase, propanol-preferring